MPKLRKCVLKTTEITTSDSDCFFRMSRLFALCVCVRACVHGDHLIGCLGCDASLPPHSQTGTNLFDPWPSPPSIHPRQHSTLEGVKRRAACQEKTTSPERLTLTSMKTTNKNTEARNHDTHMKTAYILTHQDSVHTWQHFSYTHKHTCSYLHTLNTNIENLYSSEHEFILK